jgi:hypothetical protein
VGLCRGVAISPLRVSVTFLPPDGGLEETVCKISLERVNALTLRV